MKISKSELDHLESEGKSEQEIADFIGMSRMGLYKLRKRKGWPQKERSDKGKPRKDPESRRLRKNAYMREYSFAHDVRYRTLRVSGKLISEHRYVMSEFLGRPLEKGEVVHHINGDKLDNRFENLHLFKSQSEHLEFHRNQKLESICQRMENQKVQQLQSQ